ncbi:hypothetical protein HY605_01760 [Candidatus Peregrinibacteria bacterium]|nr:hypothetical protein [Candidatus Peregrinibacteria bacterium]
MKTLSNLKKPSSALIALSVAVLIFDVQYWMMANLPGSKDLMCIPGGNLTTMNVIFSIVLGLMTGILVANMIELFRERAAKAAASSVGGLSVVVGSFTVFCPLCTIPVASIFGLSISLSFFTTYDIWIKVISIVLMIWALRLVEQQLRGTCSICVE